MSGKGWGERSVYPSPPFPPGGGESPLANQLVPGAGGGGELGAGVGGRAGGRAPFRGSVCFWGLEWVAGSEGAAVAAAAAVVAGGRDEVGKSCEAAACKLHGRAGLRRAAAAVVGAVRSVLLRGGVCGAAGAPGKGRQRGAAVLGLGGGGGSTGREQRPLPQSHSAGGERGGHASTLQPRLGGRAANRERGADKAVRARSDPRTPAGRAPSDPQGAGCRNLGPPRGRSSACGSFSGCSRGPGSFILPGALCLPGKEQPRSRGIRAVGFGARGDRTPIPLLFQRRAWVTHRAPVGLGDWAGFVQTLLPCVEGDLAGSLQCSLPGIRAASGGDRPGHPWL